jgi:exonuclease III
MDTLLSFCHQYEIDILLLQEVMHEGFSACWGYTAQVNIGKNRHGTAILMREPLSLESFDGLPSGRGIAEYYKDTYIVNIYAPSGAAMGAEREEFYNVHLPHFFR